MVDRRSLSQWLLPARCQYCDAATAGLPICEPCVAGLPWNEPACPGCARPQSHDSLCAACADDAPAYDLAFAPLLFQPPVHQAVLGLKYGAHFLSAHTLGTLLARALVRRAAPLPQLLIPVPLHGRRQRWRGYNQALELARAISRDTGIALDATAARRLRPTIDQIGQTAAERRRNMREAFAIDRHLAGLHVALVDDVMTTGATLSELARACRAAGAARVEAWAAARVP